MEQRKINRCVTILSRFAGTEVKAMITNGEYKFVYSSDLRTVEINGIKLLKYNCAAFIRLMDSILET